MEVANKLPHFRAPKLVQHLLMDGQHLPLYFSEPNDTVLVTEFPSKPFLEGIQSFGFPGDNFVPISKTQSLNGMTITPVPWGWSPTEAAKYQSWFPHSAKLFKWKPECQIWYRRETAASVLKTLREQDAKFDAALIPQQCTVVQQVEQLLNEWGSLVMKAPLSSSGRGVQFLRKPVLNDANKQWINGVLEQQGVVMVERLQNKVFDFSYHFFKHENGHVDFVGETGFITNANGKYQGNHIGEIADAPGFPENFKKEVLKKTRTLLQDAITKESAYKNYEGYLGVDLMIYSEGSQLKLHPCVEINARRSMGLLAIFLQKWITPGKKAQFLVEAKNEVNEQLFHLEKEGGKIAFCYWPLNDFWNSQKFVFMLKVD